ncbi:unnamed protein product [Alternaria alternata]
MVHINRVATHKEISEEKAQFEAIDATTSINLTPDDEADDYTATVYGSKYAAEDLPRHEMPVSDREMPPHVAYRMIKDDLTLDGTPTLNLASFVTTYMEEEAEKLMVDAFSKNFIDYEEYPVSADIQNRAYTIQLLGVLAQKKLWQNKRKAEGKPYDKPNMIMNSAVQVCWEKACRYFDVEERYVYCTTERYVMDPKECVDLVDENTIGICAILGTTYTGEYEDIKAINDLLVERNIDVDIHVDAASGGFVAPFVNPGLLWDFRLPKVTSINVSGHKYGLVYPGVGWVVWRDPKYLPQELVFNINYLGADQASFTLNFSRGASQIIGQYYQLIRLGKRGYRKIMLNLTRTADYLAANLEALGFIIMSQRSGAGLPLVACRIDEDLGKQYDEFAIAHQLRERGWVVPAYTMAPHSEKMKMLRVVVREDFTKSRCDALLADFKLALQTLDKLDAKKIEEHRQHAFAMRRRSTIVSPIYKKKTTDHFDDDHSLQGKTGKTHAVC